MNYWNRIKDDLPDPYQSHRKNELEVVDLPFFSFDEDMGIFNELFN